MASGMMSVKREDDHDVVSYVHLVEGMFLAFMGTLSIACCPTFGATRRGMLLVDPAVVIASSQRIKFHACVRSGYHQKGRKPSQNDKTEHGMEKTVQNQGQSPKISKSESILKNQSQTGVPESKKY
ncbi:hypothetical protein Tco_1467936 [Tanacetum coccineum]